MSELKQITDDLRYLRDKLDDHDTWSRQRSQEIEHRLTKVEVKSGIIATIFGAIAGLFFGSR